jgi:hypothetical protein
VWVKISIYCGLIAQARDEAIAARAVLDEMYAAARAQKTKKLSLYRHFIII